MRGTFGTFTFYTDNPKEKTRPVPGGRIVRVDVAGDHVELLVEGPDNTLRKDQPRTSVALSVYRDSSQPVARLEIGDSQIILREGEWSDWIRVEFPLISGIKSASGILRIYAKKLQPDFRVYVSPVNIDPAEPELPISTPASYSRELDAAVGPFYTQGMAEDTAALREGVLSLEEYCTQSRMVSEQHLGLLEYEMDRFSEGFLFFHFFGVDQDSHILWGKHEEKLLETYQLVDNAIGRVMEKTGDATLIVMSDHGFSSFDRAVHLNTWLWREGFLALDDPENAGDAELFVHVDWSRTQAYSLGLNALYLNQVGRERYGIVEPGRESDEVLKRIAKRLQGFRDPETGKAAVQTVYSSGDAYHGDALESAPDLIVGWAPGYRSSWQTALGAVPTTVIEDNKEEWRGDHCIAAEAVPGVFISNRRSRLKDPRLQDLTATLLTEFGASTAEGMSGRPMF
jgi:predicted AlkP superfamily phosphohydrolase/phosphomutase